MGNRLIDKKMTFQVILDKEWQKILLKLRAETRRSIKSLVEHALGETYGIDNNGNPYEVEK